MSENYVPIAKFLKQIKREIILEPEIRYNLLGVKWYGKGVFVREIKLGKEIKAKKLFKVCSGDFIYNRLFAWKSSFAIIPKEFDSCLVSGEFPTFVKNSKDVKIDFILQYILLPHNIVKVEKLSTGMSSVSRKRFKEKSFLSFPIPDLDLYEQEEISAKISKHHTFRHHLDNEIDHQQSLLKKLRQAILQEAVQGKLTAEWRKQHPELISGENHAARLLEKIKAEKEKLTKDTKRTKRMKELPPVDEEEKPFDLPEGWVWCRLGEIGIFERGKSKHRPRNAKFLFKDGIYPFIQTGDVSQSKKTNYIITSFSKKYNDLGLKQSRLWPKGTLCITIAANIAETGILGIDACFPDSVVGFTSLTNIYTTKYVRQFFEVTQSDIIKYAPATAQKNINLGIIGNLSFPLPPLTEQQAIVEKVDRLMAKIDALEEQVKARKAQAEQLMQAVLREAFNGD